MYVYMYVCMYACIHMLVCPNQTARFTGFWGFKWVPSVKNYFWNHFFISMFLVLSIYKNLQSHTSPSSLLYQGFWELIQFNRPPIYSQQCKIIGLTAKATSCKKHTHILQINLISDVWATTWPRTYVQGALWAHTGFTCTYEWKHTYFSFNWASNAQVN